MTEKRKAIQREGQKQFKKKRISSKKHNQKGGGKKRGPGLPNQLRKEINLLNQTQDSDNEDDVNFDDDGYEYEEEEAIEDLKKNHQFDPVDNFQYELPEDFKDENVESDEDDEGDSDKDDLEEGTRRHARMLEDITGLPSDAFEGKKKKDIVVSEPYPESEFNPSRDILDGDGLISMDDLLNPLRHKPGFSKINKRMKELKKKGEPVHAPLPKPVQKKLERQAAYEESKKVITKWEAPVKRNREAPTIYFDEDVNLGFSTVGAIAADFEPRTDFEKNIASLLKDTNVVEAHRKDGARLLELNKISVEDVRDRNSHLAKMRSLLFRHEIKAKRIKKIKSKTYHKLQKKDRLKAVSKAVETDPEAAKELAMKQERKRAEERMTQKHKNKGKWAKRILARGIDVQDDGTRAAISEQLQQHAELTRKMNSMRDSSSSDDSSDDDDIDEISDDSDTEGALKLLNKAKKKTVEVVEGEEELPQSGVLSLPFMVRAMKKRKEDAEKEAMLAHQEYDLSLEQLENDNGVEEKMHVGPSGRRVFGAVQKQVKEVKHANAEKIDHSYGNSDNDSEDGFVTKEDVGDDNGSLTFSQTDININRDVFREESEIGHDSVFKSFEDIARDPGLNTTYDVAIFASNSWKKMKNSSSDDVGRKSEDKLVDQASVMQHHKMTEEEGDDDSDTDDGGQMVDGTLSSGPKSTYELPSQEELIRRAFAGENVQEGDDDSDTDDGGQMVDGILSSGPKSTYELPSQEELIRRAFAGDDVEEEFHKDKEEVLNEENPEPEKPVLLPGWGQWAHVQKKKGLPSWMLAEHEVAKKKREEALKKRKDAHLNHVIISEKLDKKAEKLHTKTLPFPYTSKEAFEQSMRMPIGPEFNPVTAHGALIRPEVVKTSGVSIKPIQYEDVNPYEKSEVNKRKRPNNQKGKGNGKAKKR